MKQFANRVAVITGASSGFGLEFARIGAERGMKLVLADVNQEGLDAAEAELKARGATVVASHCDVSQADDVEALAKLARDSFGGAHLVFNNAGVGCGGLVWENTVKDWEWVLGVNLWGVIHGVRAFTPMMLEQSRTESGYEGHIVNTASVAGLLSPQLMGAYNVSKHGVVTLSETLYHDLRSVTDKISCSVLCPAFVPTGIKDSHRNRPEALRNDQPATESMRLAQQTVAKAVSSGKLTAVDVARLTFEAIETNRFYIVTHPKIMETVNMRLDDIRELSNPRDPFELRQQDRPKLNPA